MENRALAKTKDEETIISHTENLINNYKLLKEIYPEIENIDWNILDLACRYHDIGKLNTKFQNKLLEKLGYEKLEDELIEIEEVPHGYLSPAFLNAKEIEENYGEDNLKILCQAIFYHHNREKPKDFTDIKTVINEDLTKYFKEFSYSRIEKIEKLNDRYWKKIRDRLPNYDEEDDYVNKSFIMIKGLLNKIDYAASSGVLVEYKNDQLEEDTYRFFNTLKSKPNKLQRFMEENRGENIIAIASTGIGKTEGALLWIGNNKGFFTLPLRVSLNSIYDRIREKIGFNEEKLGLLHSESAKEYMKRNDGYIDKEHLDETKQLSKALTVCTLDQILDFVFKCEGFELKLATLSYSKLVIDEIQMYSPEMLGYLLWALKELTDMGGKFAIVTATFPPILRDLMRFQNIVFKENPTPFLKEDKYGNVFERHRMKVVEEKININYIKENYKGKRSLIILNTVREAQRIYNELLEYGVKNINIFHSKFTKNDRSIIEKKILDAGSVNEGVPNNPEETIWITTQVVEASLDIDFDVLYTELSDLSGLFQRMGRVYRNRQLDESTNVYVYIGTNDELPSGINKKSKSIIDYDIFNISRLAIKEFGSREIREIDKMNMINNYFTLDKLGKCEYYHKVNDTINFCKYLEPYSLNKSDVKLREINTITVIPKIVYEENIDIIEENIRLYNLDNSTKEVKVKSRDKIEGFTISIQDLEYRMAKEKSLIEGNLKLGKYEEIAIINFPYNEIGLQRPTKEEFNNVENQFI
ncbi:CRISPR-associated helicase Cas3' [Clostridium septicum]|uniref:CRISPR-associated helicase Cas3 n=1 Tax=Clostridium septicum TaxID=1504 RepID=A0ABY5AWI2_CLOSE|nr:CRISPR-associated helicase Cas3' [Clostridium septicum]MDU1313013.1 CRISPR-associated helicase Cas3' [Clostridium septicum]UEC22141.1 CRISPR-associated helicase Cas3' [Clostridium septicum]USR99829.1 CRISPR-associated helicase Cas3' [Clostridium septicum]